MSSHKKIVLILALCWSFFCLGCSSLHFTPVTPETVYGTGSRATQASASSSVEKNPTTTQPK